MPNTDFDYDRVPTDTDMRATLLPDPEQLYGWRNFFRVDNEAPNRDGDSVEYPSVDEDNNFEGEMVEIEKDDPHPQAALQYDGLSAGWQDYGFKFKLSFNDIQDAKINLVAVNQQRAMRERMRGLDGLAGQVVDANYGPEIGSDTNDINYNAFVDAETALLDEGHAPGQFAWALGPQAWGQMAKTDEFTSATEMFAGEFRADGIRLGELLGYPAVRINTGPLANSPNDAYLIDRSAYGWESPRRAFGIEREEDRDERCFWYYVNGRIDWVPTDNTRAAKIDGGVSTA